MSWTDGHEKHDRTSCQEHNPAYNADPAGSTGCARCTALLLERGDLAVKDAEKWKEVVWALARELNCLPSTFADANGHVLKAAIKLNSDLKDARGLTISEADVKGLHHMLNARDERQSYRGIRNYFAAGAADHPGMQRLLAQGLVEPIRTDGRLAYFRATRLGCLVAGLNEKQIKRAMEPD